MGRRRNKKASPSKAPSGALVKAYEGADLEARMGALNQAVLDAETLEGEDGDLATLSRTRWAGLHAGAACPERRELKRVDAEVARWLQEDCPWIRLAEVAERLPDGDCGGGALEEAARYYHALGSDRAVMMRWGASPDKIRAGLDALRRAYRDRLAEGLKVLHPLMPIVRAYQERHLEPLSCEPFRPQQKASLPSGPALWKEASHWRVLPRLAEDRPAQLRLPIPELTDGDDVRASWLVRLYDSVGGPLNTQGRGAPWALRLFVGALLHLNIDDRDGEWRRLPFPLGEVERWLHPVEPDKRWWPSRSRDWQRLPDALDYMRANMGMVHVPSLGMDVEFLRPTGIPRRPDAPLVEFSVRMPRSAARGARLDWPRLCRYGKGSAGLYRAYLGAAEYIDRSARGGEGITRLIGTPVLDKDGKPRYRGGKKIRSKETLIVNRAANFVKALSDEGLTRLAGYDPGHPENRRRALKAFKALHKDGAIELVKGDGGYQIFAARRVDPCNKP